jgi:GNAT superfamily N-acetyltransferase
MRIRPLDPTRDFPALSKLLATSEPEPPTASLLQEWEGNAPVGLVRQRLVACGDSGDSTEGEFLGFTDAAHWPWHPENAFELAAVVAPGHRGQGIGTRLIEATLAFAREHGATRLDANVRDNVAEGLRFAVRHGFARNRHIFESRLLLADFDAKQFAGAVVKAKDSGLCFQTLEDLGDTTESRRRLHDLNRRLAYEVPGNDGDFMPFEQFQKTVCNASWYRPDGQIVAVVGDEWVGMAAVGYFAVTNSMYNMFTGVEPFCRGRGIALALKLLTIECARRYGAAYISTNNDSENAPMLAVNRRLGYQPQSGYFRMRREPAF